eukprot:TRINITY_DN1275_c0_g1_i1.p1 TRINITY_DN1275_c0_g1~~TRINITY_DN1275_c0_g1_i1.p1  ORF type:complete len:658 (+),score=77.99 TRINITY_DN1275_c0_g1_i1:38-2011(+)
MAYGLWFIPLLVSASLFIFVAVEYLLLFNEANVQVDDKYSAANTHSIVSNHYNLNLNIDFANSILRGSITHYFTALADGVKKIALDARDLKIKKVVNKNTGKDLAWVMYSYDYISVLKNEQFVISLDIELKKGERIEIEIEYATSPSATAINWVPANQTFGKDMKFMYTQCEAIHCRSIAPLQDTPGIKSTFNATMTVESPYVAIASALPVKHQEVINEETGKKENVYTYMQKIPVPSYLLAMVAGHLEYKKVGQRSGVYAEPIIVNQSAYEFDEMDSFLNIIEEVLIPYAWGVYNVIIMPPSFPFGGMENPYLTFVSPSIIIGDRSSAYVVAHEICHSWFGNLITNRNWTHFWLNEGFTQYSERLILRKHYGENKYICQCRIGMHDLRESLKDFEESGKEECTKLFPNIYRAGPDDIMSDVAYEKGFLFLNYLEGLVGTRNFYKFLKVYLSTFAFKSLDAWELKSTFISFVEKYLPGNSTIILNQINWHKWYFGTGMPNDTNSDFLNDNIRQALYMADYYINNKKGPENFTLYKSFIPDLRQIFMSHLDTREKDVTVEALKAIEKDQNSTGSETNPEVQAIWFKMGVLKKYSEATARTKEFLSGIGRMKYIIPIYAAYAKTNKEYGWNLYKELKWLYHPIARELIEQIFNSQSPLT